MGFGQKRYYILAQKIAFSVSCFISGISEIRRKCREDTTVRASIKMQERPPTHGQTDGNN